MKPKHAIFLLSICGLSSITAEAVSETPSIAARSLYAVNESATDRGSISIYDIDAGHRLIKTVETVPHVGDVRGVVVSAVTGKLYVAYQDVSGIGMVYCLNIYDDTIIWNRAVSPGVDRLAINPEGQLLYVPTWEGGSADFINVLDAITGDETATLSRPGKIPNMRNNWPPTRAPTSPIPRLRRMPNPLRSRVIISAARLPPRRPTMIQTMA